MSALYPDPVTDLPYDDLHPYLEDLLSRIDALRQEARDHCGELRITDGPGQLRADAGALIDLGQRLRALAADWEALL